MNSSISIHQLPGKTIYLVKTAHVSAQSVLDVQTTIETVKPNSVCVELDSNRAAQLSQKQTWQNTDIVSIIKKKQTGLLLTSLILSSYQRKIAKQLDINVGAEMIQAMESSRLIQARIYYIDRSIQITFTRLWRSLRWLEKMKILTSLIMSLFTEEKISDEQLEKMKQSDMIETALQQVGQQFPSIKKVLVDERDQYMAEKIKQANGPIVVAVVGAAHAPGIEKALFTDHSDHQLEEIPPKKWYSKYIGWIIPIGIVLAIALTFSLDSEVGLKQIQTWILVNGVLSAIGTALVLAHPLTILTALLVAPISSLSPLLAAGWFAGFTEAIIKKPTVADFEAINNDMNTLKGFFKNRVLRILLIVIMANLFSSIGTFISSLEIFKSFFETLL